MLQVFSVRVEGGIERQCTLVASTFQQPLYLIVRGTVCFQSLAGEVAASSTGSLCVCVCVRVQSLRQGALWQLKLRPAETGEEPQIQVSAMWHQVWFQHGGCPFQRGPGKL